MSEGRFILHMKYQVSCLILSLALIPLFVWLMRSDQYNILMPQTVSSLWIFSSKFWHRHVVTVLWLAHYSSCIHRGQHRMTQSSFEVTILHSCDVLRLGPGLFCWAEPICILQHIFMGGETTGTLLPCLMGAICFHLSNISKGLTLSVSMPCVLPFSHYHAISLFCLSSTFISLCPVKCFWLNSVLCYSFDSIYVYPHHCNIILKNGFLFMVVVYNYYL